MMPAKLTPSQRKFLYSAMLALNGAMMALQQSDMIPATYAQMFAIVSLVLSAFMKHVASEESP